MFLQIPRPVHRDITEHGLQRNRFQEHMLVTKEIVGGNDGLYSSNPRRVGIYNTYT